MLLKQYFYVVLFQSVIDACSVVLAQTKVTVSSIFSIFQYCVLHSMPIFPFVRAVLF